MAACFVTVNQHMRCRSNRPWFRSPSHRRKLFQRKHTGSICIWSVKAVPKLSFHLVRCPIDQFWVVGMRPTDIFNISLTAWLCIVATGCSQYIGWGMPLFSPKDLSVVQDVLDRTRICFNICDCADSVVSNHTTCRVLLSCVTLSWWNDSCSPASYCVEPCSNSQ